MMIKNSQKIGGIAALIGATTNLIGLGVFLTLLAPTGYGFGDVDSGQFVAFLVNNQVIMHVWYMIIFVVFGVCLIVLSLAFYERLKASSPAMALVVTTFGLIWAVLVIAIGMLSINDLDIVVELYGQDPAQAVTVWLALDSVENGLGGGETIVNALWLLLSSWAALRAKELPRALNYLGVVIGVAGILTVIPALEAVVAVSGLGLIVWSIWLGIVMLRARES